VKEVKEEKKEVKKRKATKWFILFIQYYLSFVYV
jgi:hypothetical protein